MSLGKTFRSGVLTLLAAMFLSPMSGVSAATIADNIAAIQQVDQEATNNRAAAAALKELQNSATADDLLVMLKAFRDANPLAANYLRNAVETSAGRLKAAGEKLPAEGLLTFVEDTSNNPTARKIAFDLLVEIDSSHREKLIPGMLQDPSPELRREAVQQAVDEAKKLHEEKSSEAKAAFEKALAGAVDKDQVEAIVEPLKELDVTVDLQEHFGFLSKWQLIGPFDNRGLIGFDIVYPPENEIDFDATYSGTEEEVKWQELATEDSYGILDIAKNIGPYKGAAMYATTVFNSPVDQKVEFRLGTPNAWKLWLNGELQFAREEYQRGMKLDQYRIPVELKAGENRILLKLLQNEQEESWAQDYQFQFRVSDSVGSAIHPAE